MPDIADRPYLDSRAMLDTIYRLREYWPKTPPQSVVYAITALRLKREIDLSTAVTPGWRQKLRYKQILNPDENALGTVGLSWPLPRLT